MRTGQAWRRDLAGDGMTALCGGALALNLLLVAGLLAVLAYHGLGYFWQRPLELYTLRNGSRLLGEVYDREAIRGADGLDTGAARVRVKVANRDQGGADFVWVDEDEVVSRVRPADAWLLERAEWGNFHGFPVELRRGETILAAGRAQAAEAFELLLPQKRAAAVEVRRLERREQGRVNQALLRLRLDERRLELDDPPSDERQRRQNELDGRRAALDSEYEALSRRLVGLRDDLQAEVLVLETADGARAEVVAGDVIRGVRPNALGAVGGARLYLARVWEFVSDDPRESNTEGGVFPAIFGTVLMVFLMSCAVTPLGVLAALYLREYARQGPIVRGVRIAVNNLAGVPSIVFGVFGLGFFVYIMGGSIDRIFYPEALPSPTYGTGGVLWASLTLALLTVPVVIVATEEGLAAVPRVVREGSLALGATRFETTWRVVLPAAAPGVLTGVILAMARAAGEVAPLMIVGMVKLAPSLPVDGTFPFVHFERKFMHLGFHIYDVGFQSPNVEAAKPLVFATALLLIALVTAMNLVAIAVRNRLRARAAGSAV